MKKRLFVTFFCCFTLFFLACTANAEKPFTQATLGMTLNDVKAIEPDIAQTENESDWSCSRTFSDEDGTLYFRFLDNKVARISWVAHPATEDAQALYRKITKLTTAYYGKPDTSQTNDIKTGMSVAQSMNAWKMDDSTVLCSIVELSKSGTCEVCFNQQIKTELP